MRALLLATAALAAIPAMAGAQDATERRREQAYQNLNQLEQNQRIGEVERQIDNIEMRRQSEAALRALQPPTRVLPGTYLVGGSSAQTGVYPLQGRAPGASVLERPSTAPATTGAAYDPGPNVLNRPAAYYMPPFAGTPLPELPSLREAGAPYALSTDAGSTEDRLRDLELSASNARLRDIAAAQRGN